MSAAFHRSAAMTACIVMFFSGLAASSMSSQSLDLSLLPAFEDNMYAQLLMRVLSGALDARNRVNNHEENRHAHDQPQNAASQHGHTALDSRQLESIYRALTVAWEEQIPGDFVEAGAGSGGAAIFASGVIKQLRLGRNVWVHCRLVVVSR